MLRQYELVDRVLDYDPDADEALLNRAYRREIEATVTRITKIETALEPDFQRHFVAAMAFPNKLDAYPELCRVQPLPNRGADGSVVSNRPDTGGSPVGDGRRRRAGSRAWTSATGSNWKARS